MISGPLSPHLTKNPPQSAPAKTAPFPERPCKPLWESAATHNTEDITLAIKQGANVNEPYPSNGNTPLHIAAWNGYADIVKLLLAQPDINKNSKNSAGKTPLELAEEKRFKEIILLLKD